MFWIGLVITVIGGLVGSPLVRGWIQSILHWELDNKLFEVMVVVFIFGGAIISVGTYISDEHENQRTKQELQSTKSKLDAVLEEKKQVEEMKRTPPIVEFNLLLTNEEQKLVLIPIVEVKNRIPIKFRWQVGVSKKDNKDFKSVGSVMIQSISFYPTEKTYKFHGTPARAVLLTDISKEYKLNEEYFIALYFLYSSIYYQEVGYPKELSGSGLYRYVLTAQGLEKVE